MASILPTHRGVGQDWRHADPLSAGPMHEYIKNNSKVDILSSDYDEPGEELSRTAHIWEAYVTETDQSDKEMCDDWDRSLDVTLIFATLFSSILTGFVVESAKKLEPDPGRILQNTLNVLVNHTTNQPVNTADLYSFHISSSAVWVNKLWFVSLMLGVGVALVAMLAKKWCHKFMSSRVGPYHEQARRRQQRWDGMERWKMQSVMNGLSLAMHVSLALFAIGLSVYLWDLSPEVAIPVVVISSVLFALYAVATILPAISKFCPYRTALSGPLMVVMAYVSFIMRGLLVGVLYVLLSFPWLIAELLANCSPDDDSEDLRPSTNGIPQLWNVFAPTGMSEKVETAGEVTPMDITTSRIIAWLITNSENSNNVGVALQAISGASSELPRGPLSRISASAGVVSHLRRHFSSTKLQGSSHEMRGNLEAASRLFRALSYLLVMDGATHSTLVRNLFRGADEARELEVAAIYHRLMDHCLESSNDSDMIVLGVSALLPFPCWVASCPAKRKLESVTAGSVKTLLCIVQRHIAGDITLSDDALLAFSHMCGRHFVVHSKRNDTSRQLVHTLLHLQPNSGRSNSILRHALALALGAAAVNVIHRKTDRIMYPAQDFVDHYTHNKAYRSSNWGDTYSHMLLLGVVGAMPDVSFYSIPDLKSDRIGLLTSRVSPSSGLQLKALQSDLTWDQLAGKCVVECLAKNTNLSPQAENTMVSCLSVLGRHFNPEVDLTHHPKAILAICGARTDKLYHFGLDLCKVKYYTYSATTKCLEEDSLDALAQYELTGRTFELSIEANPRTSPQAMQRLWTMARAILVSTRCSPTKRLRALSPMLEHDMFTAVRGLTWDRGLPNGIDDLHLERIWYDSLKSMITLGSAHQVDGGIIQDVVEHYGNQILAASFSQQTLDCVERVEILDRWRALQELYDNQRAPKHGKLHEPSWRPRIRRTKS